MSESPSAHASTSYSLHYRQRRRRWVPKGVMLLMLLFVVGLLSACGKAPEAMTAAIAVPQETSTHGSIGESCAYASGSLVSTGTQRRLHAQSGALQRVGLNVF